MGAQSFCAYCVVHERPVWDGGIEGNREGISECDGEPSNRGNQLVNRLCNRNTVTEQRPSHPAIPTTSSTISWGFLGEDRNDLRDIRGGLIPLAAGTSGVQAIDDRVASTPLLVDIILLRVEVIGAAAERLKVINGCW